MKPILLNKYFIGYLLIYVAAAAELHFSFGQPLADIGTIFLSFGVTLSLIAWLLFKNITSADERKLLIRNEVVIIIGLVALFVWYVTYGSSLLNKLFPESITSVPWKNEFAILAKKLLVFVAIPLIIYKAAGFSLKDFGLDISKLRFSRNSFLTFIVMSIAVLIFQYFLSDGAKPVREGQFNSHQLIIGLPLLFIWLVVEAGLVEEFFFRAFLQSRLSVLLRSPVAGIVVSGLIFGLAHAPGLYLRGAESEGVTEQMPFIFWASYTICFMSIAGIFLGIIYYRTKNLWLVMLLHAMVDLLPNLDDFIGSGHIK